MEKPSAEVMLLLVLKEFCDERADVLPRYVARVLSSNSSDCSNTDSGAACRSSTTLVKNIH